MAKVSSAKAPYPCPPPLIYVLSKQRILVYLEINMDSPPSHMHHSWPPPVVQSKSGRRQHGAIRRPSQTRHIISTLVGFAVGATFGMCLTTTKSLLSADIAFSSAPYFAASPSNIPNVPKEGARQDDDHGGEGEDDENYIPTYPILGVRVESRKHLPASSIPGSRWYDVPIPPPKTSREERQVMQRKHMVSAFETLLPDACSAKGPDDQRWFLWLEDDVIPFPGSFRRVGGIIRALQERHSDVGRPTFVRLGVGLTASLIRCWEAETLLLQTLKRVNYPVDEVIARAMKGQTLSYETSLFGHEDTSGVESSIQVGIPFGDESSKTTTMTSLSIGSTSKVKFGVLQEKKVGAQRAENQEGKLLLSTNLSTPRHAFDTACLGYAWSPCPTKGGVWAPTSDLGWFDDDRAGRTSTSDSTMAKHSEPQYSGSRWTVVHAKNAKETCDLVCSRYGSDCDAIGLAELNSPLTFLQRSGVACDEIFHKPSSNTPAYTRVLGSKEKHLTTSCMLGFSKPTCQGEESRAITRYESERRICACKPINISRYIYDSG